MSRHNNKLSCNTKTWTKQLERIKRQVKGVEREMKRLEVCVRFVSGFAGKAMFFIGKEECQFTTLTLYIAKRGMSAHTNLLGLAGGSRPQ